MSKEKLYIFDTTLRDGAQTQGVDFSIDDKIKIAEALDKLGVDVVTMSFVPEALSAKFYGMKVAGMAVITNDTLKPEQANHDEVLNITRRLSGKPKETLRDTLLKCKINNVI